MVEQPLEFSIGDEVTVTGPIGGTGFKGPMDGVVVSSDHKGYGVDFRMSVDGGHSLEGLLGMRYHGLWCQTSNLVPKKPKQPSAIPLFDAIMACKADASPAITDDDTSSRADLAKYLLSSSSQTIATASEIRLLQDTVQAILTRVVAQRQKQHDLLEEVFN